MTNEKKKMVFGHDSHRERNHFSAGGAIKDDAHGAGMKLASVQRYSHGCRQFTIR